MIGTFPPPVHGMAVVNAAMLAALRAVDAQPVVINTSAPDLDRGLWSRLGRLPRVLRGMVRLAFGGWPRGTRLYIGVSGGFGQVYDVVFLLVGRLRGMRVFVHHHNYSYVDRSHRLTRGLVAAAGRQATHVVLCMRMARDLERWYPSVRHTRALSNAWTLAPVGHRGQPARAALNTVGFLSNICAAKGVFTFLDTVAALNSLGVAVQAKLAGPFQDDETEARVRRRLSDLRNVEYVGPQYGADKERFFASIDVLLFPTQYRNEAEPIVSLEALANGVPVVAYGRGCIPCVVTPEAGLVVDPSADFVTAAAQRIQTWRQSPEALRVASAAARARFEVLRTKALRARQELVDELLKGDRA